MWLIENAHATWTDYFRTYAFALCAMRCASIPISRS
jgi:hypothetical protein